MTLTEAIGIASLLSLGDAGFVEEAARVLQPRQVRMALVVLVRLRVKGPLRSVPDYVREMLDSFEASGFPEIEERNGRWAPKDSI